MLSAYWVFGCPEVQVTMGGFQDVVVVAAGFAIR